MATALRPLTRSAERIPRPDAVGAALMLLFVAPVALGVLGTVLPAFGFLPELGGTRLSVEPWRELFDRPGLWRAAALSLTVGLATAALSLAIVIAFAAHWHGTRPFQIVRRLLSPLLSVPHVAVAIGLAFLIAPSGWIFRLLSATGLAGPLPPDLASVQDPLGLSLMLGLTLKETPFLLLMTLVALGQVRTEESLTVARALGHARSAAWLAVILPQIYPQLRLPIYAVLAYSASVVDVSLILGPTAPPTLAVLVWRGFHDPELAQLYWASAGACLQLALAALGILIWRAGEAAFAGVGRRRIAAGWPGRRARLGPTAALTAVLTTVAAAGAGLGANLLWSVAERWPAGAALPASLTLSAWRHQLAGARETIEVTATLGIASAGAAVLVAIALLERQARRRSAAAAHPVWLIYAPLILPQIGFLFGVQGLLVMLEIDGTWMGLIWTHFLFVMPYAYLSLSEPFAALDPRYARTALCLGRSPLAVLLTVKLPLLARPLLVALALGFAVSVGQYLPTLFAGAGRFHTVTTEAVALAAGGDRRVIGVYAGLQMLLPALAFAVALALTRRKRP